MPLEIAAKPLVFILRDNLISEEGKQIMAELFANVEAADNAVMMLAGHRWPEMLTRYSHAGVIDLASARAQVARAVGGKHNRKTRNAWK